MGENKAGVRRAGIGAERPGARADAGLTVAVLGVAAGWTAGLGAAASPGLTVPGLVAAGVTL